MWFSVTSSWQIHYYSTLTFLSLKNRKSLKKNPSSRIFFHFLYSFNFQGLFSFWRIICQTFFLFNSLFEFGFFFCFQYNSKMFWTWLNFGLKQIFLFYFLLYDFNWLLLHYCFFPLPWERLSENIILQCLFSVYKVTQYHDQ